MIRVLGSKPIQTGAEAVMRPVETDREPSTPIGKCLGSRTGSDVLCRLRAFGDLPVGGEVVIPTGGLTSYPLIHVVAQLREELIWKRHISV